jgi:hypothetical protein
MVKSLGSDSNSGGREFNSWSKDHLSWLKPFVVFISLFQTVTDSQIRAQALSFAFSPTYCPMSLYHYIIGANNRTSTTNQLHPDVLLSILSHHSYIILNVTANTRLSVPLHRSTYMQLNTTEHRPSREANRFSGRQAIPRTLWNPKLITALTIACYLFLPWATAIQPKPPHRTSLRSILILSLYAPLLVQYVLHAPPSHSSL